MGFEASASSSKIPRYRISQGPLWSISQRKGLESLGSRPWILDGETGTGRQKDLPKVPRQVAGGAWMSQLSSRLSLIALHFLLLFSS